MKKILAILVVVVAASGWQQAVHADWIHGVGQRPKEAPYVPTSQETVEIMLKLAEVSGEDLLYDLGSGDGRIVITAAATFGTRGIGVEIDPSLVRLSREKAAQANISHLVQFITADLFTIDFREATVVTLYLFQHMNIQLRPKLLNDLRPGSRIVSNTFDMGEWEPDQTAQGEFSTILYWVVPANISGVWKWDRIGNDGDTTHFVLELKQRFQEATGTLSVDGTAVPVEIGKIVGDTIDFTMVAAEGPLYFEGKVTGNSIEGTIRAEDGRTDWRATRDPATMSPL